MLDLGCNTFANAVSAICLSVYSTLPLLKYLPARLPNLFFFPLWVSAFSYENLFPSFVSLYLPQFCVCVFFFVFFVSSQQCSLLDK